MQDQRPETEQNGEAEQEQEVSPERKRERRNPTAIYKPKYRRPMNAGKKCSICRHPARQDMELMLSRGESQHAVARHFNLPNYGALGNHWRKHVDENMKIAKKIEVLKPGADLETLCEEENVGLLAHLQRIRSVLYPMFDNAAKIGDAHKVAALSSQLHLNLRLSALKTGELAQHRSQTINNLFVSQDYVILRARLMAVLRSFPEAAQAVADAFRQMENVAEPPRLIDRSPLPKIKGPIDLVALD